MEEREGTGHFQPRPHAGDPETAERSGKPVSQNDDEEAQLLKSDEGRGFLSDLHYIKDLAENQGKLEDAASRLTLLLDRYPDSPHLLFLLAYCLLKAGRYGFAYTIVQRCAALVPNRPEVWNNLGLCVGKIGRLAEAKEILKKALALDPDNAPAYNNLALCHVNECEPEEALACAKRALEIRPDMNDALETAGYANLLLGNFEEGWKGYEASLDGQYRKIRKLHDEPYYDREKHKDAQILVQGEQGLGDEISFASMLSEIARDKKIIVECDARLEGVMKRSFPDVEIWGTRYIKRRGWDAKIGASCLIGTLAGEYRKTAADFPGTPYLKTDPDRCLQWRALLDTLPGRKIGIAWTGGCDHTFKARRSLKLEQLEPILRVPGNTFISLQYAPPGHEIASFEKKTGIRVHHWKRAAESQDYDDVLALVQELDLVICVTTALVDACGAIGKECWTLVPAKPHWRFGMRGHQNTWYRSCKSYRQGKGEDWDVIIRAVAEDLSRRRSAAASRVYRTAELDHQAGLEAGIYYPAHTLAASDQAPRPDGIHIHEISSAVSV